MPWTIHDGKVELRCIEPLVCDIDSDTTFTLFLQVIHNPGELECCLSLRFGFFTVPLDNMRGYSSSLEHHPTYGSRLPVVDVSDHCQIHVRLLSCHNHPPINMGLSLYSLFMRVLLIGDASILIISISPNGGNSPDFQVNRQSDITK